MKLITSDKGGGQCFCPCSFMCLLARLRVFKNACMDLDEMLRVDRCQDMDKLVNFDWARFGLQSGCRNPIAFSLISYKRWYAEFYVRKIPRMRIDFKMVLFTQPSKHLCRRWMRSTECPSSSYLTTRPTCSQPRDPDLDLLTSTWHHELLTVDLILNLRSLQVLV